MNRKEVAELIPIIQAFLEGRTIERKTRSWEFNKGWRDETQWEETEELICRDTFVYRIKPEPKYRPFKNAEECLKEMSKHTPFGWLKEIKRDIWTQISYVHNEGIETVNSGSASYKSLFDCFTFFDRKPFGIKVEE